MKGSETGFYKLNLRVWVSFVVIFLSGISYLTRPAGAGFREGLLSNPGGPSTEAPRFEAKPDSLPGEVLVKFRPEFFAIRDAVHAEIGAEVLSTLPDIGVQRVRGKRGQTTAALMKAYADRREVEYAEENGIVRPQATPDDPLFPQAWDLNHTEPLGGTLDADIDAVEAWDIITGGEGVVAVLDSGVDYQHPDLADNIWTNPGEIPGNGTDDDGNGFVDDVHGWNFVDDNNDPMDLRYHGTHVSGTIAAVGNNGLGIAGINWKAKIMPVKFFKVNAEGSFDAAAAAILYASKMGARVANASWGGASVSRTIEEALNVARQRGMLLIASAGNNGQDNDGRQKHYPCVSTAVNVLCVAATDQRDQKADFSNYGATTVDLAAPGVDILSTVLKECAKEFQDKCDPSGYKALSGTSMAAAHVSGAAALVLSRYPDLTVADLRKLLLETVDSVSSLNGITVSGGRLNIHNALNGFSDLSVTFTAAPNATIGSSFPATIKVANHGLSTATSVELMVTLPPGVTFVSSSLGSGGCSGTGIIQCRVGNIGNGTEATVEMSFLPTTEGEKRTKAEVSAGPVDPDMGNNSVMAAVVVHPLPVSETPPPPISDGDGAGTPPAPNAGGDGGGAPPVPSGGGEGAVVPPSSGKSGGGCAMKTGSDSDPTLIGFFLLALGALLRKEMKRSKRKPIENGKIILP